MRSENIEEYTALWGRTLVRSAIGALELLLEREPKPKKNSEIEFSIQELYGLVGASNSNAFIKKSRAIFKLIAPEKVRETYPYLSYTFFTSLKTMKKSNRLEDYVDAYAKSLILDLSNNHITAEETASIKDIIIDQEAFATSVIDVYRAFEDKKLVEESLKLSQEKLEYRIQIGALRLSELRILCLVLEISISYNLVDAQGKETKIELG